MTCSGCHQLKSKIFWYFKRFSQKIAKFLILNYGQPLIKIGFRKIDSLYEAYGGDEFMQLWQVISISSKRSHVIQ